MCEYGRQLRSRVLWASCLENEMSLCRCIPGRLPSMQTPAHHYNTLCQHVSRAHIISRHVLLLWRYWSACLCDGRGSRGAKPADMVVSGTSYLCLEDLCSPAPELQSACVYTWLWMYVPLHTVLCTALCWGVCKMPADGSIVVLGEAAVVNGCVILTPGFNECGQGSLLDVEWACRAGSRLEST